MIFLKAKLHC